MRILPLLLLLPSLAWAELAVENAWIQNLPPTVPVRAGYLTLTNTGAGAVRIVDLHGAAFTRIEIHRSVTKDGIMHMEAVPQLVIEGGQSLSFEPGGLHLMMYPGQPTRPGESYRIVIELDDGSSQEIDMKVRK